MAGAVSCGEGSTGKDVLVNFCGVTAFVVAFVPTRIDDTCKAVNVPTPDELSAAVSNNVWALVVIGVASVILSRIVNPAGYVNRYGYVAVAMVLTLGVIVAAHFIDDRFTHWLFWLEATIIAEFAIYWVIQTEELWNVVNREQLPPKASVQPAVGAPV